MSDPTDNNQSSNNVVDEGRDADVIAMMHEMKAEIAALRTEVSSLKHLSTDTLGLAREIRQLVGPFGTPLSDGKMLVQSLFGIKYVIDPMDLIIGPQLIVYRQWEAELSAMFAHAANKDMVFVDVGANFGYFTCLLGSLIGTSGAGRVWAIEPNPTCVKLMETNVAINWSMCPIHLIPNAAGASSGELEFIVPRNRASNASFVGRNQDVTALDSERFIVKVQPLDDTLPTSEVVDLMKIDVEGHEWSVLSGAKNLISRSPNIRIIMEWAPDQMMTAGFTASDMSNLFDELGLQGHLSSGSIRVGDALGPALDHDALMSHTYDNIVLKHR